MDVAAMNVRITIQKSETVIDNIGNHTSQWNDFYSPFATVSGEGGVEKAVAGMVVDDSDISFTIRYCNMISKISSTEYRVLFMDEIYNLLSIDHLNFKKKALKLKCQKVRR